LGGLAGVTPVMIKKRRRGQQARGTRKQRLAGIAA
jgi:hypothetical protein